MPCAEFQSLPSFLRAATADAQVPGVDVDAVSISPELSPGCNDPVRLGLVAGQRVSISPELSPGCNRTCMWTRTVSARARFQSLPSFLRAATRPGRSASGWRYWRFQSLPSFLRAATEYVIGAAPPQQNDVSISPELSPGCNALLGMFSRYLRSCFNLSRAFSGLQRASNATAFCPRHVSISPELSPGCNPTTASAASPRSPTFQSLPSFLRAATRRQRGRRPRTVCFNLSRAFSGLQRLGLLS